jgi:S-adenosylmethionine-dependent carboxyl methyltransferase
MRKTFEQRNSGQAVMEGEGSYNNHGRIPAAGAALAIPLLEHAVRNVSLNHTRDPVVIADYGSSQGKNSLAPMRIAIRGLRARLGPNRPVTVFHIDQPSNDFNSLVEVLSCDPDRYISDDGNVFPCAIGRSFYEQVLPVASVHLGWCSYAAVWLRRIPSLIPGHFFSLSSTGAPRTAFERQAAEDWEAFLSVRAREMRTGARLVVVLPGISDHQLEGFREFMDHANSVLAEMADEGAITTGERTQMVLSSYPRRESELLGPFSNGRFENLVVEHFEECLLPDPIWAEYERDGDEEELARKQALRFRAVFMPSLASALTSVQAGDSEALCRFADRLQEGMTRCLTNHPVRTDSVVQTIVLARSR